MLSQVVNGVVLPFVLIFMLLLINKKELMGEYVNTRLFNAIAWADDRHHDRADDCVVLDAARRLAEPGRVTQVNVRLKTSEKSSRSQILHQRSIGFKKIV